MYAQRAVSDTAARAERVSAELAAAKSTIESLKRAKDSFAEQLLKARDEARSVVENRVMGEMAALQERSARDLAEIRKNSREVRVSWCND